MIGCGVNKYAVIETRGKRKQTNKQSKNGEEKRWNFGVHTKNEIGLGSSRMSYKMNEYLVDEGASLDYALLDGVAHQPLFSCVSVDESNCQTWKLQLDQTNLHSTPTHHQNLILLIEELNVK